MDNQAEDLVNHEDCTESDNKEAQLDEDDEKSTAETADSPVCVLADQLQMLMDSCRQETYRRFSEMRLEFHTSFHAISYDEVDSTTDLISLSRRKLSENSTDQSPAEKRLHILRVNKIFRDVAQALGQRSTTSQLWKPIFYQLMAEYPYEVIREAEHEIEKEKPFMKAYKSLIKWKETAGDVFDINRLVKVLEANNMQELANQATETLNSELAILLYIGLLLQSIILYIGLLLKSYYRPTVTIILQAYCYNHIIVPFHTIILYRPTAAKIML